MWFHDDFSNNIPMEECNEYKEILITVSIKISKLLIIGFQLNFNKMSMLFQKDSNEQNRF